MKNKNKKWILGVSLRIFLAAVALALQLPKVDDWVIHALYPDAWLASQAILGGAVHYIQAVAFGAAITLAAEVMLTLFARIAKYGAAIARRKDRRAASPRRVAVGRAAFYQEYDDAA
ncbi:MAG: hypothetical protein LBD16_02825 [Oscillospiraceae bacterium]|nr:hypothetical protein [Oscillospiraceae bacterium]